MIHKLDIDYINNTIDNDKIIENTNSKIKHYNLIFLILLTIIIIVLITYRKDIKYSNILIGFFMIFAIYIFIQIINTYSDSTDNDIIKLLNSINDNNYKIIEIDNFLSDEECNELIKYAESSTYEKSKVLTTTGNALSIDRESEQIWISDDKHNVVKKISDFCKKLTNKSISNMEDLQLLKYQKGGYFVDHYDPETTYSSNTNDRIYTFIVYLNDDFNGGETSFKEINANVKPKKGKAVLFKSLDNTGNLLTKSLHKGSEVTEGTKYMCNKWIHINDFK